MKKYFVSYKFYTKKGEGFGAVEITMTDKIKDYKDVLEIHDWIITNSEFEGQKFTQVAILNFIPL